MNALKDRICDAIRANGPMPVSLYMLMCLHDPSDGYYAAHPGLNADFTTAPETTQVFGELIGLWAAHEWMAMGSPDPFWLIELGPGRGAMMEDALRACRSVPGFEDAVRIALVEASPVLRQMQRDRLSGVNVEHFDDIDAIPPGPSIILANEFLDCMAIRQYIRDGNRWRERCIGLDGISGLRFGIGLQAELPANVLPVGDSVEVAHGMEALVEVLARRFRRHPGRALFIDYGPEDRSPGDTLRAFQKGEQVDPLTDPGLCDLTADVDFPRFRRLSESEGIAVHGPIQQGYFLKRLGAVERTRTLAAANPRRAEDIKAATLKLVSPDGMGERFKVLCLAPPGSPTPPGF